MLRPCLENGVPLAQLSRERKLQLRTLQRWVRAYRQRGLLGLVRSDESAGSLEVSCTEYLHNFLFNLKATATALQQ